MAEASSNHGLMPLLDACCAALQEALRSLTGRRVDVARGALTVPSPAEAAASCVRPTTIVTAALDGTDAGASLVLALDTGEAVTLAGSMLMTPDQSIAERRALGVLEGADAEAFAEISTAVCTALGGVLGPRVGSGLRSLGATSVAPGTATADDFGTAPLVRLALAVQVQGFSASQTSLFVPRATAERWNGGPIVLTERDPGDDDGPAAPIRGRIAAFLCDPQTSATLRRSCRRVGLEVDKRPRGEVPNPAVYKDALVLIEIGPGEDRRFDWIRRLKAFEASTRVVVVLAVPSRQSVLHAARAGADVVVGHPLDVRLLAQKLEQLLDPAPSTSGSNETA